MDEPTLYGCDSCDLRTYSPFDQLLRCATAREAIGGRCTGTLNPVDDEAEEARADG